MYFYFIFNKKKKGKGSVKLYLPKKESITRNTHLAIWQVKVQ